MTWTSLLSRQLIGGAATWDANTSATAVNPLGGVFNGLGNPLQVTQEGSPGMGVLVNAGYCAVAHATQGHGAYIFGQLTQGTLTVANNSSGSTRIDLIIARVYDLGNSSSYCDVEIVAGTPGSGQPATPGTSILLATISVASGASSILNANITDKRTYTVAPGGILPAASGAAPALMEGQFTYNTTSGTLSGVGGGSGVTGAVDTSTGATGLTPGSGSSYGWGIGFGSTDSGFFFFFDDDDDADGQVVPQIQETFTADGSTDFQIDAKWGLAVPEAAVDSGSPSVSRGQCRIIIMIDGTVLDTVYLRCAASGGTTQPGDAGSFTYYTSAILGTTPAAGTHTATLAVETENTTSGEFSGAHVGDLASTGTSSSAFGSVPSYFTTALTQENCYLRVGAISASTV
jgi:hypothetical protein